MKEKASAAPLLLISRQGRLLVLGLTSFGMTWLGIGTMNTCTQSTTELWSWQMLPEKLQESAHKFKLCCLWSQV